MVHCGCESGLSARLWVSVSETADSYYNADLHWFRLWQKK